MTMTIITKSRLLLITLLLSILLSIVACASLSGKNFGKLVPNADVTTALNKAEINPNYDYYITGSDYFPRSILGLDKSYIFDSVLWKKVEFKPEELKELTVRMQQRAINCRRGEFGFVVLDNKDKQIGIWYSILVPGMSIKVLDDRKIIVYPPNDEQYKCYDDQ